MADNVNFQREPIAPDFGQLMEDHSMTAQPTLDLPAGVTITGAVQPRFDEVLTRDALAFVADLHRRFNETRKRLLATR